MGSSKDRQEPDELDLDSELVKDLEPGEADTEGVRGGAAISATWCPGSSCYQAGCGTNSPTYTCGHLLIP